MKMTKRVLSVFAALLMLAMMIPVVASAATEDVSFTVTNNKDDYTFSIYQLATLDTATGQYTKVAASDDIMTVINDPASVTADILAACDAKSAASFGAAYKTFTKGTETYTVPSGIYYIRATAMPSTVKSVTNSIVALPFTRTTAGVEEKVTTEGPIVLAGKVDEGSVTVTKAITNSKFAGAAAYTTAETDEVVNFKLTASVVGSTEKKLKSYVIHDEMDAGLTFVKEDDIVVALTGGTAAAKTLDPADYVVNKINDQHFTVTLDYTNILSKDDFYSHANVEVTCYAKLNANAVIGTAGNKNKDWLVYKNAENVESTKQGNNVYVYTFSLKIKKVDAADANTTLSGAEFKVFRTAADAAAGTNAIDTVTTGADGTAAFTTFKFDANKKYYIKETKAPTGYNLDNTVREITTPAATFSATGALANPTSGVLDYSSAAFTDVKSKLPETGGEGTLMFTVIGGSLVLIAAALFVIVMKKRSAAK